MNSINSSEQVGQSCPITPDLVDSSLTRIFSIFTFSIIVIYVFTPFKWLMFWPTIEFAIRVFGGIKYSPTCLLIKAGLDISHVVTKKVNAGPKRFAAKIGLLFTLLMSLSFVLDWPILSMVFGIISLIAVGAEAVLGFCVACFMYNYLKKIGIKV